MRFGSRELLFLVIMIGLLLGAWYFVFQKANDRLAMLRKDTKEKQEQLDLLSRTRKDISDINVEMAELKKGIEVFEQKLPSAREVDTTLRSIQEMAATNQLNVKQVTSLTTEKAAGYMEQQMSLVVTGDFLRFYGFLLNVERLDRITRIGQLRMEKIGDVEGSMTANMVLSIFYVPETAAAN